LLDHEAVPSVVFDDVAIDTLVATRATPPRTIEDAVLLFLHGGSYAHYSPKDPWYASFASRLAHATRRVVVSPAYRLAPAHPFPVALEDALATLRHLRRQGHRVIICGDSAGGGLAVSVALSAPADVVGVIALSGLFDLTAASGSYDAGVDPLFSAAPDEERRSTIRDGLVYLGKVDREGACRKKDVESVLHASWCCWPPTLVKRLRDWRCSPLFASPALLAKLPPTLLVAGAREVLLEDSLLLGGRLACRVVVFEDMWHDFFLYGEGRGAGGAVLAEAQACLDLVAAWVDDLAAPTETRGPTFLTATDEPAAPSPGRERTPPATMTARRKAALLPRAFANYASAADKRMTASNWTTLLTMAGVFEVEHVKVLKADLIFSVLARDGALGYRSFRQALRQVAVTLYPEATEEQAFRKLVEEDVLPRVTLVSFDEARDAGLLEV